MSVRVIPFLIAVFLSTACSTGHGALVLTINYTGDAQFASAFTSAKTTWEGLLAGYQDGVVATRSLGSSYQVGQQVSQVFIDASIVAIDGVGGTLGQAGFTQRVVDTSGFSLSTDGIMRFDSADAGNLLAGGTWESVILHELAHVIGFGTQWGAGLNNLYTNGSGEFQGVNATNAWQNDFGQTGTPDVELDGGSGTANSHWNENLNGIGLTGITDSLGRDMQNELMTGWLNPNPFISNMTVQSFVDIGFTATAVPEPNSLAFLLIGSVGICLTRRRSTR